VSKRLEAFTDWLAIVCITLLVFAGKMPWEWGAGIIGAIAGITGAAKGMGKPGSTIGIIGVGGAKFIAAILGTGKLS
jgi:hypothetical protein